ncbi:MAG: inositol monophosphatase [Chlamydiae bacterium]|nr:inositol monophosphatase [Chlamydiota bacterium]
MNLPIFLFLIMSLVFIQEKGVSAFQKAENALLFADTSKLAWTKDFDIFTRTAIEAALVASHILKEGQKKKLSIQDKEGAGNVVTESDIRAETEIIRIILSQFPYHGILAEETKSNGVPNNEYVWIIDPLDGSKNYSKGLPIYSISIALFYQNQPVLGVIFVPNLEQMFVADEQGAYLNGKPLNVSQTTLLSKALLASGYPYAVKENPLNCMEVENAMIQTEAQVNNLGTSVLHLAYVAAGLFDGQFHAGLRAWDIAAASLMIRHAGGILTDWEGNPINFLTLDSIDALASNGTLHVPLLAKIKEARQIRPDSK